MDPGHCPFIAKIQVFGKNCFAKIPDGFAQRLPETLVDRAVQVSVHRVFRCAPAQALVAVRTAFVAHYCVVAACAAFCVPTLRVCRSLAAQVPCPAAARVEQIFADQFRRGPEAEEDATINSFPGGCIY